jgi:GTP cyclohydrolase I
VSDAPNFKLIIDEILRGLRYDPTDQHFARTAERWIAMLGEFQAPQPDEDTTSILGTEFEDSYSGMVVVDHIKFSSLCAHHLAPFAGEAHVGYLPSGKVVGISKLARLVEHVTHRITIQETATREIAAALNAVLQPRGAAVVLSAYHTCMTVRGIRSDAARTVTSSLSGAFLENAHGCRDEFYRLMGG